MEDNAYHHNISINLANIVLSGAFIEGSEHDQSINFYDYILKSNAVAQTIGTGRQQFGNSSNQKLPEMEVSFDAAIKILATTMALFIFRQKMQQQHFNLEPQKIRLPKS